MAAKDSSSKKYRGVDPEDYYNYEDQYLETGGGGSGGKDKGGKGKKTIQNIKRQQRIQTLQQRGDELEAALREVLDGFPEFDTGEKEEQFLLEYSSWIEANLSHFGPLDISQIEVNFSKSGGPGGQNVNKRETKVALRHKPTWIRVVNDQTRSQGKNRELALELLRKHLENHLLDWRMYLGQNQPFEISLVKSLLEGDY